MLFYPHLATYRHFLVLNTLFCHHLQQQFFHFFLRQLINVDSFFFLSNIQQFTIVAETNLQGVHILIATGHVVAMSFKLVANE